MKSKKAKIKTILGSKQKSPEVKMVGGQIPFELAERLSLYCIIEKTNKAAIVRQILSDFLREQSDFQTMLNLLVQKMNLHWQKLVQTKKGRFKKQYWNLFKNNLQKELVRKKLSDSSIQYIMDNIKKD